MSDVNDSEDSHVLVDEIDATFFKTTQTMALLKYCQASGVTATAHKKDEMSMEL